MRHLLPIPMLLALAAPAAAQVTVNPRALEPLGGGALSQQGAPAAAGPAKPSHATAHRHHPPPRHGAQAGREEQNKPEEQKKPRQAAVAHAPVAHAPVAHGPVAHGPAAPRSAVRAPPVVPPAPPPVAMLPPMVPPPPAHPSTPPPPAPVVAGAPGDAVPIPGGLRVTFAPEKAELNPETDAALQKLAHATAASPDATVTVMAYAAGPPDDPSTPRRVSLSRALAARSVLIAQGIPSTHIFVRALGAVASDAPPDRVDVTVSAAAVAPAR